MRGATSKAGRLALALEKIRRLSPGEVLHFRYGREEWDITHLAADWGGPTERYLYHGPGCGGVNVPLERFVDAVQA